MSRFLKVSLTVQSFRRVTFTEFPCVYGSLYKICKDVRTHFKSNIL